MTVTYHSSRLSGAVTSPSSTPAPVIIPSLIAIAPAALALVPVPGIGHLCVVEASKLKCRRNLMLSVNIGVFFFFNFNVIFLIELPWAAKLAEVHFSSVALVKG